MSTLLMIPGENRVFWMALSGDGSLLATVDLSVLDKQRDGSCRTRLMIRDYRKISRV